MLILNRQCQKAQRSCIYETELHGSIYTIYNTVCSLPVPLSYNAVHQEPGYETRAGPAGPVLAGVTGYLGPQRQNGIPPGDLQYFLTCMEEGSKFPGFALEKWYRDAIFPGVPNKGIIIISNIVFLLHAQITLNTHFLSLYGIIYH